ncbi:ribonuclease H-like domain-containing protein [Tanacetum coccineum]
MAGSQDDIPPPPPPSQTPTQQTPHTVSTIKLPILKKGEYDIWAMKIEHYLAYTDYPIWEVIQNGNGPVSISTDTHGQIKVLPPRIAEEILARERERKARTTLLMALPKDHLAKFHKMTDAKEMWEAIKSRFIGNDESKKMQKYILKQQFEGFSISNSEGLHKGYGMFQSLLSQLEIHGASVSTKDANQKFLRSLPSAWSQVSLIRRTKPGLVSLSFDDLYNNLRVFENDVKGSTASSSSTQNVAFVSENTSSTNDVSNAYGVSNPSGHNSQYEQTSSYSLLANQSSFPQLDHEDLEQLDEFDLEEMDLKWHVAMISIRMKKTKGNKDSKRRDAWRRWNKDGNRNCKHEDSKALEAEKEKEDLKVKVEKWHNSSKNLSLLQNSQMSANDKFRLGFVTAEGMHVVPPPMIGNYMTSGPDIETDYSQFTYETSEFVTETIVNEPRVVCQPKVWSDAPIIEEYESDSEDEHVSLPTEEQETPSFANKQVELNKQKVKGNVQREYIPIWNNVQRVNHKNQFVPIAVLTRTGKILVSTARASVSAVGRKRETAVKFSAGCNWRPERHYWHKDYPHRALKNKGIVDSGCSRKLDFEDVCFVKELQHFNLFSVSQMCDKKNKVLFTDIECLVLSPKFKLPDVNQVLLRIPRQNNMYSFNLENLVPSGGLACLIAKATIDESNKWHRRLGHVNFKNLNKLVKGNLVREFKNRDFIEFCGSKGIKREYSNARTPQQNGVAERKNRTLIEAARTMLADSFLPNTFWAEAVSTACYVLNRVLVTKPQNKTPYELITGKIPIISYIRPFGCHVTILNTIDHLGKFDGKSDEGFLVGYSLQSKAFRVYNLETKRVEENLYITFLENKPNVAGKGPTWLFDLDYLTDSMNYQPVRLKNQANKHAGPQEANQNAGTKKNIDVGDSPIEAESAQDYFVLPILSSYTSTVKSSKASEEPTKHPDFKQLKFSGRSLLKKLRICFYKQEKASSTNIVNTASTPVSTASHYGGLSFTDLATTNQDDSEIPALEEIYANPTDDGILPNSSYDDEHCLFACFLSQNEPKNISEALEDKSWVDAMQEELLQFKIQKVWILVDLPYGEDGNWNNWVVNFLAGRLLFLGNAKADNCVTSELQRQNNVAVANCLGKNPVYHSKTKHIAIRHYFIRDAYEKKLIQVLKIHTDDNVADLQTKAFDVSRESLGRAIDGIEALLLPKLFILWLAKVSTDNANLVPLGKDSVPNRDVEENTAKALISYSPTITNSTTMAVLESCLKHNMVAYLEKTDGNVEFHEIIDFLARSSIHNALTASLVVSTIFFEQFWMSAKSKIINNVRYITAKVAGKPVSISEA